MSDRISNRIRTFMSRDWQRVRLRKDAYWADRVERLGPSEGLRIADELRRQVMRQKPNWPDAESRRQDLDAHIRLARCFALADAVCRR